MALIAVWSVMWAVTMTGWMSASAWGRPRVVAYYMYWTTDTYPCTKIDYSQITHIAHAFVWPLTNGTLNVHRNYLYPQLVQEAHSNGVKVIVSVGGGSKSVNFSTMANDPVARSNFVYQLTSFSVSNHYDGVDIDWEAPANATDRANFTALVQELRAAFNAVNSNLTLSAAVRSTADSGQWLDLDQVMGAFDWIGVMTYDYHGPWSAHAGYDAPLYRSVADTHNGYWVDASVQYFLSRNVPREKLLLGIPLFACQFDATGLYAANTAGSDLTYADVRQKLSNGWTRVWDSTSLVPYAVNAAHTQLITYDDPVSVRYKCEYAVNHGLGGAILWALGQDLYEGQTPLLDVVGSNLLRGSSVVTTLDTFEGRSGTLYSSPVASTSTVGIAKTSTATLTNGVAHGGSNSLVLVLKDDPGSHSNWVVRLLCGNGNPATRTNVGTSGYVGFWLKATAANVSASMAVHDANGVRRSVARPVTDDGSWNLYEWKLNDPSQWTDGAGVMNGPMVSVDSIWFYAPDNSSDMTIYLDDVYQISPVHDGH